MSIGIGCFEASSSFWLKLSAAPVAASRCSGAHLEDSAAQMSGINVHEFHSSVVGLGYPGEQKLLRCEAEMEEVVGRMPEQPEAQAFCSPRGLHLKHSDQDIVGPVDSQAVVPAVRHSEYAAHDHRPRAFVAYDRHSDQEVVDYGGAVRGFPSVPPPDRHVNQVLENADAGRLPLPAYISHDRHSDQVLLERDERLEGDNMHPLVPKTIDFIGQHSGHLVKEASQLLRLHPCASSDAHFHNAAVAAPSGEGQEEVSEAGSRGEGNIVSGLTEGLTSDSETGAASNMCENGVGPFTGQLNSVPDAEGVSLVIQSVEAEMNRLRKEHEHLHQQREDLQQKMTCIEMELARLQGIRVLELEKQRSEGYVMEQSDGDGQQQQEMVSSVALGGLGVQVDCFSQPVSQHPHELFAEAVSTPEVHAYAPSAAIRAPDPQHALRLFDGYNWRKYGEILQPGALYPRVFYGCTNMGCIARKIEERTDEGLMKRIYEGLHNHPVPRKAVRLLETLKRRRRYKR